MTAPAILAIALIATVVTLLGMAIFRKIARNRRRQRVLNRYASAWSGDAGGMPPPSAWRGTSGRR